MAKTIEQLVVQLVADVDGLKRGFDEGERRTQKGTQKMGSFISEFSKESARHLSMVGGSLGAVADGLLAIGTGTGGIQALVGGLKSTITAAMDFESAMTGVAKTVDASQEEIASMGKEFLALSTRLPITASELAKVGEAAGQLGIKKEAIVGFAETMAKLGMTTDLTADQAATAFGQIANITGLATDQIDELASVLVRLGNSGASTESQILMMAQRIAGAGELVGLTEPAMLALSAAFADVGISAELGGGNVSKALTQMNSAVIAGGKELEAFAKIAGVSGAEFARVFKQDAAQAVVLFLEGLNRLKIEGKDASAAMEAAGLTGAEIGQVFLRTSGNVNGLKTGLAAANQEFRESNALNEEAAKRIGTTASQWKLFQSQLDAFQIRIGEIFLPIIGKILEGWTKIFDLIGEVMDRSVDAQAQEAIALAAKREEGGFHIVQSEPHARGTITTGPELALIGEAGPEAVVPLRGNPFSNLAGLLGVRTMATGGVVGDIAGGGAVDFSELGAIATWMNNQDRINKMLAEMAKEGTGATKALSGWTAVVNKSKAFIGPPVSGAGAHAAPPEYSKFMGPPRPDGSVLGTQTIGEVISGELVKGLQEWDKANPLHVDTEGLATEITKAVHQGLGMGTKSANKDEDKTWTPADLVQLPGGWQDPVKGRNVDPNSIAGQMMADWKAGQYQGGKTGEGPININEELMKSMQDTIAGFNQTAADLAARTQALADAPTSNVGVDEVGDGTTLGMVYAMGTLAENLRILSQTFFVDKQGIDALLPSVKNAGELLDMMNKQTIGLIGSWSNFGSIMSMVNQQASNAKYLGALNAIATNTIIGSEELANFTATVMGGNAQMEMAGAINDIWAQNAANQAAQMAQLTGATQAATVGLYGAAVGFQSVGVGLAQVGAALGGTSGHPGVVGYGGPPLGSGGSYTGPILSSSTLDAINGVGGPTIAPSGTPGRTGSAGMGSYNPYANAGASGGMMQVNLILDGQKQASAMAPYSAGYNEWNMRPTAR